METQKQKDAISKFLGVNTDSKGKWTELPNKMHSD